jgi:hypothetical protein
MNTLLSEHTREGEELFSLTDNQLHAPLTFAEANINDPSRQSSGFLLMEDMIGCRLHCPEMDNVLHRLEMRAVTSESPAVAEQCRQVGGGVIIIMVRARHQGLPTCPGQPNLVVGQADIYANLPDGQSNILPFC